MRWEMKVNQAFCLHKWAVYQNSLRIQLTIEYTDVTRETAVIEVNLKDTGELNPDGLVLLVIPQLNLLLFGLKEDAGIARVTMELENAGGTVKNLDLEYAVANPEEAVNHQISWRDEPLIHDKIVFLPQDDRILMEFTLRSSTHASAIDQMTIAAEAPLIYETEDILGDIAADLQMLEFFSGANAAREAASALTQLQAQLTDGSVSAEEAVPVFQEQEQVLVSCISGTQQDIQSYRQEIMLENDSRKGR